MDYKRRIKMMFRVEVACYITGSVLLLMPLLFNLVASMSATIQTVSPDSAARDTGTNKWTYIVFGLVLFIDGIFLRRKREKLVTEQKNEGNN